MADDKEKLKFLVSLTTHDWDVRVGAWHCSVLRLPGATIDAVYVNSLAQDERFYRVDAGHGLLHWSAPQDRPDGVTLAVTLSRELADKDDLDRKHKADKDDLDRKHKRDLLIVMLVVGLIGAVATILAAMLRTASAAPSDNAGSPKASASAPLATNAPVATARPFLNSICYHVVADLAPDGGKSYRRDTFDCSAPDAADPERVTMILPAKLLPASGQHVLLVKIKEPPVEWKVESAAAAAHYLLFSDWHGFEDMLRFHASMLASISEVVIFDEIRQQQTDAGERVALLIGRTITNVDLPAVAKRYPGRWPLSFAELPPAAVGSSASETPAEAKALGELSRVWDAARNRCRAEFAWADGPDLRPGVMTITAMPNGTIETDFRDGASGKDSKEATGSLEDAKRPRRMGKDAALRYKRCLDKEIRTQRVSPYEGRPVGRRVSR